MSVAHDVGVRLYAPGDRVPESGIYRVTHVGHREDHPVQALKGEVFPSCRKCRQKVRFRLWLEAGHMTHDWDLAGPPFELIK